MILCYAGLPKNGSPVAFILLNCYLRYIDSCYMEHPENDKIYKGLKVNGGVESLGSVNP